MLLTTRIGPLPFYHREEIHGGSHNADTPPTHPIYTSASVIDHITPLFLEERGSTIFEVRTNVNGVSWSTQKTITYLRAGSLDQGCAWLHFTAKTAKEMRAEIAKVL